MFALEPLQAEHAEILKKHAGASPKGSPRAQGRLATAPGPLRCMSMCWDRAVHVSPATPASQPGAASARDKLAYLVGFTRRPCTTAALRQHCRDRAPAASQPSSPSSCPRKSRGLISSAVLAHPSHIPGHRFLLRPGLRRGEAQPSLSIPISAGHGFSRRITDSIAALAACSRTKTWRC